MSIQQSHSVLMTWVCCLLCSLTSGFFAFLVLPLLSPYGDTSLPKPVSLYTGCDLPLFIYISVPFPPTFVSPGCSCSLTESTPCTDGAELLDCSKGESLDPHCKLFYAFSSPQLFLSCSCPFCHAFLFSSLLPCLVGAHHVHEPAASMGDEVVPLALKTYRRKRGMSCG